MELVQQIKKALDNSNIDLARNLLEDLRATSQDRKLCHDLGNLIQRAICKQFLEDEGLVL